jgi:signal transduction histidine kinase
MDQETMARIFEPFFSTKRTGRGLGLAAVQGIIRRHRGVLCVSSIVRQGTSFRIWLPVNEDSEI